MDGVRRAGVSAFGFGGTNFHAVLEEYIPHRLTGNGKRRLRSVQLPTARTTQHERKALPAAAIACRSRAKAPLRGALVIGAASEAHWLSVCAPSRKPPSGQAPPSPRPAEADLRAPERLAIDYADAAELADKSAKALKALAAEPARRVESSARARHFPRSRSRAQGGVPLYRPRVAVRQHAAAALRRRTDRRRDLRAKRTA